MLFLAICPLILLVGCTSKAHASRFGTGLKVLTAHEAKSFHTVVRRQKRGWWWGESREENYRRQREQAKDNQEKARLYRELRCRHVCWKPWPDWGACDGPCNTGIQRRTRTRDPDVASDCRGMPCPGPNMETKMCHRDCSPGGVVITQGRCYCKRGWSGECCEKRNTCRRPPDPQNGFIVTAPPNDGLYNYDDAIILKCKEGYGMIGPQLRRCLLNGGWSGDETTCVRVQCPALPSPPNGVLVGAKTTPYVVGDTVRYRCHTGYALHGWGFLQCQAGLGRVGEWSHSEPECLPRTCGDPGTPRFGRRIGDRFTYGGVVRFECYHGYQLVGSKERQCIESGSWSGYQPVCQHIFCKVPQPPRYGDISDQRSHVNITIVFSCRHGYWMEGNKAVTCFHNGSWSSPFPKCKAIGCGDPGKPQNGTRNDNGYLLGQQVTFACYEGFTIDGASESTCLRTKQWSSPVPKCIACPRGYYKTGVNPGGGCQRCADHAHTVTVASSRRTHCVCNHGYGGPPGGPCSRITCPLLKTPVSGKQLTCGRNYGDVCMYDCNDGYVLRHGSSLRSCTVDGTWDGVEPICTPCPKNTYKASPASCLPCPPNSYTQGEASMRQGCRCAKGYVGPKGGPCRDVNECATPSGSGPCQQTCTNHDGGYTCSCSILGYQLQPDLHTCYAAKECTNLTQNDAPRHGGLVCHWFPEQNSQHCTVKCNPGYEHPARSNAYETCGPSTGFRWLFKQAGSKQPGKPKKGLPPCIEDLFGGFQMDGSSAYFARACEIMSQLEHREVRLEFTQMLTDQGICIKKARRVCNIENVGIICGKRSKRQAGVLDIASVTLRFSILADSGKVKQADCRPTICPMLRVPANYCDRYCHKAYERFKKASVLYARVQLNRLFEERRDNLTFRAAARLFRPQNVTARTSGARINCSPGTEAVGSVCVPCTEGNFRSSLTYKCAPCPVGTYSDRQMATHCSTCPPGTTTKSTGGTTCSVCEEGYYGQGCRIKCNCVHGKCNPITGECTCSQGWEGEHCGTDINECDLGVCPRGTKCIDTKAPGTGFKCQPCPSGYNGNGLLCLKIQK